jgi:lipopolysaccharide/colanic/teichoic acid biosynthesis glycosyltransferase
MKTTTQLIETNTEFVDANSTNNLVTKTENIKTFLYIGRTIGRTKKCMSFFENSHKATNFFVAKSFLTAQLSVNSPKPNLIIIDLPFDAAQLVDFISFLHANKWSYNIPVIYNETALSAVELKTLSATQLVDDIVNVESYCNKLEKKANFLQRSKVFSNQAILPKPQPFINKIKNETTGGFNYLLKRGLDISIASLAFILLLPLMIIIALAVKISSKGPVIYKSKRAGKGFKVFNFYKFRTMVVNADKQVTKLQELNRYETGPAFFKVTNDPRVNKLGSFLRKTSMDELPQLINVIKGDMSLVGNRPLPLYEANALTTDEWAERFMAPAGITGLWQIKKRSVEDMTSEQRMSLDINYARNNNVFRDIWIMANTPTALLQKSDA